MLVQLEEWENNTNQEREKLETEIEHLSDGVRQIQEMIKQLDREQTQKTKQLEGERENWQQAQIQVAQLQTRLDVYEQGLKPLQRQLDETKHQLGILGQWLNPS